VLKDKGAGADIHKDNFNATIVDRTGILAETQLPNNIQGAQQLLLFLHRHKCPQIAMESTGPYWMGLYDYLTHHGVKVLLANPANLKAIVGKKTDRVDAMVLAYLHMAGLVTPSYVPDKSYRKLRNLCRTREKMVRMRTQIKNATTTQIHTFSSELTTVFADIFGRSGMKMLTTILGHIQDVQNQNQNRASTQPPGPPGPPGPLSAPNPLDLLGRAGAEEAVEAEEGVRTVAEKEIPSVLQKLKKAGLKESKIRKVGTALHKAYTPSIDAGMAQFFLGLVQFLDRTIKEMDDQLARLICQDQRIGRQVMLLVSIPGVSLVTAASIVAEICDVSRFSSDRKMAGYMGLAPSVYQSGSKRITGRITKRGSPHPRRAYYQAAISIIRSGQKGPPELVEFYNRIRSRKGHKVAAVALAKKLVTITYHMLTRQQNYQSYMEWERSKGRQKMDRIQSRARRAEKKKTCLAQLLEMAQRIEVLEVIPQELRAAHA